MGKIVAISGGELSDPRSKLIHDEIIALSGKAAPRVLFIPTASNDSEGYFQRFREHFGAGRCRVEVLYLVNRQPTVEKISEAVLSSDIVYVGGGNTLKMMMLWRKLGVDRVLLKAYEQGIVLSGISAGAICWFKYGSSDSRQFTNPEADLIKVRGLGLVNALFCPHYDTAVNRKSHLQNLMQKTPGIALALDEYCALAIVDGRYRLIKAGENINGYKVYWHKKLLHEEVIEHYKDLLPLSGIITQ